ncbi:facilitated trehalose transporter Tret1-like [Chrysoperla carnea]|uniref:facilitated trehalose transporter Tret1-like n=1 Tax=Chrysoperla carnea TaxID=189513 RepID=UPI001D07B9AB|nr:facilitated trehalose transporter Tret1-like [Chrysoperla carnea]
MTLEQGEKLPNRDHKYVEVQTEDKETGNCEPKRNYTQEYISATISTLGTIICGIQFAWLGPILPQLLSGNFKIQITLEQSVWVIGVLHIGALPGSILASKLTNYFGRKNTIFLTTIPFILSSLINIFAETVVHYYIAQFIGGLGFGASFVVVSTYISEISSPEIRGILSTLIQLAKSVGILIVFVLGAYLPIVTYCSVLAIFPIIQLICTFYLPETPYFHVIKKDYNKAEKALKFLRNKSMVQDELKCLIEGFKEEIPESHQSFWDVFRDKTNLKSIIILTVLLMGQTWTGFSAFFGYSQVIFEDSHSSISAETCGIFVALMNFGVVFLSGPLIDRYGRRKLLMASGIITFLPLAMLGGYFYLQDYTNFEHIEKLRLIPLIAMVFYKFSYGMGLSGIPYIMAGELFPTSVKSYAISIITINRGAIGVVGNKIYQVVLSEFDYPGVFVMFIILLILLLIFVYFAVPETKGLTLEEIQVKLRKSNKT